MSKIDKNALLILGAILAFGLVLQHSRNARLRKLGREIDQDAEEDIFDDLA